MHLGNGIKSPADQIGTFLFSLSFLKMSISFLESHALLFSVFKIMHDQYRKVTTKKRQQENENNPLFYNPRQSQHFSVCSLVYIVLVCLSIFIPMWDISHRALQLASFCHSPVCPLTLLLLLPNLFFFIILYCRLFLKFFYKHMLSFFIFFSNIYLVSS